jgi:RHS repeat-associated protein
VRATFAYDNRDRVTVQTDVHGVTLTFAYDAADRRTLVQDSLGGTVTSVYDAADRLTSRQLGAVGTLTNATRVDFTYTNNDLLSKVTRFSDAAGTTVVGTTIYSYDNANRVTTILHDNASNATLSYYAYNYDAVDRVTSQNWKTGSTTGAETYTYDAASQLLTDATASGTSTYTYDANGNRTIAGYQTGTGNELTNDGTYTYTYDSAGNMTQKSKGLGLETWYYGYDTLNHLTSVRETTNGTTNELTVTYTYDVLGDRVQQDKWKTGSSTVSTRFAYDGQNVWADTDTSNNVLARYLHGDGADQILARSVANNQTNAGVALYLTDMLGSVRDLENTSQTIIDHLDYTAFGVVTETTASAGDRYKYQGGQYDADTGEVRFGRRDDIPTIARWDVQDALGLNPDTNLYRFVRNDPTNATDPSGLEDLKPGELPKGGNKIPSRDLFRVPLPDRLGGIPIPDPFFAELVEGAENADNAIKNVFGFFLLANSPCVWVKVNVTATASVVYRAVANVFGKTTTFSRYDQNLSFALTQYVNWSLSKAFPRYYLKCKCEKGKSCKNWGKPTTFPIPRTLSIPPFSYARDIPFGPAVGSIRIRIEFHPDITISVGECA